MVMVIVMMISMIMMTNGRGGNVFCVYDDDDGVDD